MKKNYKGKGSKKNIKRNKKAIFVRKLKRGFLLFIILFFMGGIALNSSHFNGYKSNVYASMKEQYMQDEEGNVVTEKDTDIVKNYKLTVNTDLRQPSNVSSEEIDKILEGTNLYGLGKAFVEAEEKYNVNALYMVGLACLESAYGTSSFAIERNNLYGWNAIDSNPGNASSFESKAEATLYVASKLQKNYLTEGGAYYEGYTPRSVDVHYCTDKQHADKIVSIVSELIKKLG